ncbi:MAG: glycosyltransferase family 2 protein [Bacteroidetes bacterium]|nr:glycosyltransferase family 2 protein [Bacteroidota bacterium]
MLLIFYLSLLIIIYTYIGYPAILFFLVQAKRLLHNNHAKAFEFDQLPPATLIIACYNEAEILQAKIENTLQLKYPVNRLSIYFVTDGSTDNSTEIIKKHPRIHLFHEPDRKGKNAAINRIMPLVDTPVVVFTDANTYLNEDALFLMVRHYADKNVGAVAGEKKVIKTSTRSAAESGEGAYWKYESLLKKWDSELGTVVGAAGELFSIRRELFEEVPKHVLIEDFRLSMRVAEQGYRVVYEPSAYAMEHSSASMQEEEKRKVRIAAGGLIEVFHFLRLLNIFRYGVLSFQYVSHRMLRWTLAPISLVLIFLTNAYLAFDGGTIFVLTLSMQLIFYSIALLGYFFQNQWSGLFVVPYYFSFMNIAVFKGAWNLLSGKQSVVWAKAERRKVI